MFQIFVKAKQGKSTTIWTLSSDTINEIKEKIALKEGLEMKDQRLVFAGRELASDRALSDYNIKENNTLWLVIRVRGGMNADRATDSEGRMAEMELNYASEALNTRIDELTHRVDEIGEVFVTDQMST